MSKRGAVYILGAGASCLSPAPEARRPLQNGFFAFIAASKLVPQQMVLEGFMQQPFKQWLLKKGYGEPYNPKSRLTNDSMINLEEFYSEIETDNGVNSDDKTEILRILDRIIFESVSIPIGELRNNPNKSCPNHRALTGLILPDNTIMNFSYDCLADDALLYFCPSWHPLTGHGFNFNDVIGGTPPDKAKIFQSKVFITQTSWLNYISLQNR
jgi:hypothetical protein